VVKTLGCEIDNFVFDRLRDVPPESKYPCYEAPD
jgi:hypothetical protein